MIDALFDPLSQATTVRSLIEIVLLGLIGGALGCWVVLYGLSYSAESFSHALFPGLVLGGAGRRAAAGRRRTRGAARGCRGRARLAGARHRS